MSDGTRPAVLRGSDCSAGFTFSVNRVTEGWRVLLLGEKVCLTISDSIPRKHMTEILPLLVSQTKRGLKTS